jgi:hypothetical protein
MSIFSLALILATTLNRRSSAASSTVTSSPSFSTSFSLSSSLISPASTVHLCVVSIASSLTRNSHISLSTVGSGIGLSLLLGDMAIKFLFSLCCRKQRICSGLLYHNWCRPPALRPISVQDLI